MKKKFIALLAFITVMAVLFVACNKPGKSSVKESESLIGESVSLQESNSDLESEGPSAFESEEESRQESASEGQSDSTSEEESQSESENQSESIPEIEEYVTVTFTYHYADGVRDYHGAKQVLKGAGFEEVIVSCTPEGTHERFIDDMIDFLVDGQSVWGTDWTLQEECEIAPVFGTIRFSQNIGDVGLKIVDENGNVLLQDVTRFLKGTTVRWALIEKFLFTEEELTHVVEMDVDGESCDFSFNLMGDCVLTLVVDQPITNQITTTLIIKEADGREIYNQSAISNRWPSVQGLLLNIYRVYDEYFLYFDVIKVNGEVVDERYVITEDNSVIEITLRPRGAETVNVGITVTYPNGESSPEQVIEVATGTGIREVILIFTEGDEEALSDITDVLLNGESIWNSEWIVSEACSIVIMVDVEMPPFTLCEVSLYGEDIHGNVLYEMSQQVEQGTSVMDALRNVFMLDEEVIGKVVCFAITEVGAIRDPYSEIITEDCGIFIIIDNSAIGGTVYGAVTLTVVDDRGEQESGYYQMLSESVTLEEIINVLLSKSFAELSEMGSFYSESGDILDASSVIFAGETVKFVYSSGATAGITVHFYGEDITLENGTTLSQLIDMAGVNGEEFYWYVNDVQVELDYVLCDGDRVVAQPKGDMAGFNVWFDVDGDGDITSNDQFFVPHGTTLEEFVNNWLVYNWAYTFTDYLSAMTEGYFTVDGNRAEGNDSLSAEVTVAYVHEPNAGGCDHSFDENGSCGNCGFVCSHDTFEVDRACGICGITVRVSTRVTVYYFEGYQEEGVFYSIGYRSNEYYGERYYNDPAPRVGDIIRDSTGAEMGDMGDDGFVRVWTRNGNDTYYDDEVQNGDYLVGLPEGVVIPEFTVRISVEEGESAEYVYDYPVEIEEVQQRFFAEYGQINFDYYTYRVISDYGSYELTWQETTVEFMLAQESVSFVLIDENGVTEPIEDSFRADQKPTLREYLTAKGISDTSEYFIYRGSELVEVNTCGTEYWRVTVIKRSIVQSEFTVSVTLIVDGVEKHGTVTVDTPIAFETLLSLPFTTEEEEIFHIGWERDNIYTLNGVDYCFINGGSDPSYIFVIGDSELIARRGYFVYLEEGYNCYETVYGERKTGAEILASLGLELNLDKYYISCNGIRYDSQGFLNAVFPTDNMHCSIDLEPGKVGVSYYYEDVYGGWGSDYIEVLDSIRISDFISEDIFNLCKWILVDEEGYYVCDITSYDQIFEFDPQNCDDWATTRYSIKGEPTHFSVLLYIDGEWIGEQIFPVDGGLTFGQILSEFGNYSYNDYTWTFYGVDEVYENTVITARLEANGTDMRPRFTLYVNNEEYVIRHTRSMTLAEVIEAVNAEYGTSIVYDDYMWGGHTPDEIVANEGYWGEVSGRTLTAVKVCFYGAIGPVSFEDGSNNRTYERGDEWITPTEFHGTEMYYGVVEFTGKWVYRTNAGEGLEVSVESVEDLFALQSEEVELTAEFEVNYQRLYGTYVTDSNYVVIINENGLTYINGNENFVESRDASYEVFYTSSLWIEFDGGRYLDGMCLQEYFKVDEGETVIFAGNSFSYNRYDSIEDFENSTGVYVQISNIQTAEGETVPVIGTGVYFVTLEKIEE